MSQAHNVASCFVNQVQLHSEVHATQQKELEEFANSIYDQLPPDLLSSVELACEKGASNWLSCLPLKFHGFALHKTAFRDAVMLRYHWRPLVCPTSAYVAMILQLTTVFLVLRVIFLHYDTTRSMI